MSELLNETARIYYDPAFIAGLENWLRVHDALAKEALEAEAAAYIQGLA